MEFTCPCCQKKVTEENTSNTIELLKSNGYWQEVTPEQPIIFTLPHYKWACDNCLTNKKAVLADIAKQNYMSRADPFKKPFHLAYAPMKIVCRLCEKPFNVSIQQQQRFYEALKRPIRSVPTVCFDCSKMDNLSPEEKKIAVLKKKGLDTNKHKLRKLVAAYKEMNDLENVQKYQSMLDNVLAPARQKIAELTQNGEPTDVRILIKLAQLYEKIDEGETAAQYRILIKKLQTEWWEANVRLKPKTVVEPKPEPKKTPINVAPVKKAKRKRIVKSFIEPENLEPEVEPADDGFFYGYWDE